MSANSSSSIGGSSLFPLPSYNYLVCLNSTTGSFIFFSFAITNFILNLPLVALVLYIGLQRWWQRRCTFKITVTSHADLFTYHMVAMEIFGLVGSTCYCYGNYMENLQMMMKAFFFFSIIFPGENFFHCLTCAERYLAVVHPITYLGLKMEGGARIRNISIGCVWLMGFGWIGVMFMFYPNFPTLLFFITCVFSLVVIAFCSVSVLCALSRPSPGEGGGDMERVDQVKQRAFHTIMAIMGTLLLRFAGVMFCLVLYILVPRAGGDPCLVLNSLYWLCVPSSVVLPLLFLHRSGKLAWVGYNTEST